ncbi:class I adenylate-forming enzyme family protein [Zhihengliuella halotolerans]|uniref:Crotonobetaine/carnitine-CoA ligase n=1 Tax=Zhihengliuella halotolerans TaxID=370736 RepID=A0A4V2G9I1_9MICC|nr:AMP-binding protein [Zhihengliuella halotolerans]RZU60476.1 crotonobetaine/carnitine-CoA ligase [Zhihengliuella halotolerans]
MGENTTSVDEAREFIHGPGLGEELQRLARTAPDRVYLRDRERSVTAAELDGRVDDAAARLREFGVIATSRVAIALPVGVDHVVLIFALLRLGALWIPLNTQLKGEPLLHQLGDSQATDVVVEARAPLAGHLPDTEAADIALPGATGGPLTVFRLASPAGGQGARRGAALLMYTSGTTGPPKGVLVSETMLRAAVLGAIEVTGPEPGDVFYVWEPLFHIGGAQVVFVPLYREVTLALAPKFSASRFWRDVVDFSVTHIHYLGGVLQILLQQPVTDAERANRVRVAWGAGATEEVRAACAQRYDFALHECYGMTETSSIVTVNRHESDGGIGHPLPWVDIDVVHDGGPASGTGPAQGGEILVKGHIGGLLTPGYLGRPEASESARRGQWFRTGDQGRFDASGRLHFLGRGSDSIRVRGENVSAWQVENVFAMHPGIDRCAAVGVDADIGEQEILLLVTRAGGNEADPAELLEWGAGQLPRFQVPRYIKVVPEMPLTPSQRIAKHRLPRDLDSAVELPR